VAALAGVSDTWYTWLEQGRDMRISSEMLDATCRALQLSEDECRYVRQLAGTPEAESTDPDRVSEQALSRLRPLLDDLLPSSAALATVTWDLLAWNAVYQRLFGDPLLLAAHRRNWLWRWFMTPEMVRVRDRHFVTQHIVGWFRSEQARYPHNERVEFLIRDLLAESDDFREAWEDRRVEPSVLTEITFDHPDVGEIRLDLVQLMVTEHPPVLLIIHRPSDSVSRDRASRLAQRCDCVVGSIKS
jgi:transcriptional regulator with XRE-family HTH domain